MQIQHDTAGYGNKIVQVMRRKGMFCKCDSTLDLCQAIWQAISLRDVQTENEHMQGKTLGFNS